MKVKTSITLSKDVLHSVDRYAKQQQRSRSDLIERALRDFMLQLAAAERNARDLDILNRNAARLNAEAADVLAYQKPL